MRKLLLVLVVSVSVLGCSIPVAFRKPGVGADVAEVDRQRCAYEVLLHEQNIRNTFEQMYVRNELMVRCMEARGYRLERLEH